MTGPVTPPAGRARLPRGASSLPRAVVEREQRQRLVRACARVVAARGYAACAVADILREAGVSRATFYELFADKEACFLYGLRKLRDAHLRQVEEALAAEGPAPERLHAALAAWLARVDLDRTLAHAFIAEAAGATPRSREAFAQARRQLQDLLRHWFEEVRRDWPEVPALAPEALPLVMTGLTGWITDRIRRDEPLGDDALRALLGFVLAGLGLYGWAGAVRAGRPLPARGAAAP